MRKIKEVLRLHADCRLAGRAIARSLGIAPATVYEYISRARVANLTWPLPPELDDDALEARLFPPQDELPTERVTPDWNDIHQQLRLPGVTLQLLWEEYKARHADGGYQYSRFCGLYREWARRVDVTMRQQHRAGERLFVDYSGTTVAVVTPDSGEVRQAQIFVAVLGASNFTYAEATWTQRVPDWLASHIHAFEYFGGVPTLVVPDNLKAGVTRPDRYDPDLASAYNELARHYGTAIVPARVRKPRDKAKVEAGVLLVQRWILAALRHQTFFSLVELNQAIRGLLDRLNDRPFKKMPGSRRSVFDAVERPALRPLPRDRHLVAEHRKARVHSSDHHVELLGHYYSVPYTLVRQEVELRYTTSTVEVLHRGRRIASHLRSFERGKHTTLPEHMAPQHQRYLEWTPERITTWAARLGPSVAGMTAAILASRDHPVQGFRACLGLLRLEKQYGAARLDAACGRALFFGTHGYRSVERILRGGLDLKPLPPRIPLPMPPPAHENVRGAAYYAPEATHA
ncbi:MAG: IS21 family transposase [Candidatus Sericytochromatia bacterium]|nr:IS21 family transposase [Candidatus Sericytochromatia bacterium]